MKGMKCRNKQWLAIVFTVAVGMGFGAAQAETTADKDAHGAHHGKDWPGVYYGFTPCADCVGVKTTLALNKNDSYILITQFAGKSDREFTEKGKVSWGENNETLILTPNKGNGIHRYLVGDNALIQLDDAGKRITGKLADRYILQRTDVTEQTKSHGH